MAFLQEEQLDALTIRRMIFHVVDANQLTLLEEVAPGSSSEFFLERIKSTNNGIMFDFSSDSSVLQHLNSVAVNQDAFVDASKALANSFQRQHSGSTSRGVFLMFELSANEERFYALIKYDHELVVSYQILDREARHYALLQEVKDTFVKSPDALQKSALIRLTPEGGELCVRDRVTKNVGHYFKAFLGANRRHNETDLTTKLSDLTQRVAKQYPEELSTEAKKSLRERLYNTIQLQEGFSPEDSEQFIAAVYGPLAEDSRLRKAFHRQLRTMRIESESFTFDKQAIRKPSKRRIVTQEGIQVIFDRQFEQSVEIRELHGNRKQIVIDTGGIEENDDFPERNPR